MNTPPTSRPAEESFAVRKATRPAWDVLSERALVILIYLCGISAIVFVLGIFFFVFKEALPILGNSHFSVTASSP